MEDGWTGSKSDQHNNLEEQPTQLSIWSPFHEPADLGLLHWLEVGQTAVKRRGVLVTLSQNPSHLVRHTIRLSSYPRTLL